MKTFRFSLFALLVALMSLSKVHAQIPTDSIVADFNEFVRLLEETHPDPYTNYGGRPFFRKAAMETRLKLIQDSVTSSSVLAHRIGEFLTPLSDGHTSIWDDSFDWWKHAPIRFLAMNQGIMYVQVLPAQYKELLGSKLLGIENMSIQDVVTGLTQQSIYPAENEMGRLLMLCWDCASLDKVIPNIPEDSITYHLESPEGKQVSITLPYKLHFDSDSGLEQCEIPYTNIFPSKHLAFDFVGEGKNTMFLCLNSIMARDCIEFMRDNGWEYESSVASLFRQMYRGQEMPSDPNVAIAMLPSFSDEFEKMLIEMKRNKSKNLIIDLRGNSGGFTPIVIPTLYQMWGDEFIKKSSSFDTKGYTKISPLLLK